MIKLKNILLVLAFISFLKIKCQTFEKKYSGWWGDTNWIFEFKSNATYQRLSAGHYGSNLVLGNYKIYKDTIMLLSGFKNTDGTVNEKYLIEKDSIIIDLELYYDYKLIRKETAFYNSKKRYDILTKYYESSKFDSLVIVNKNQFDIIIKFCTKLLTVFKINEIQNVDHIKIIRLINAIRISQSDLLKHGIYADFMKLVEDINYDKQMYTYYDWIPNKGMGFYFKQLNIELGGTPRMYSVFKINDI